MKTIICILVLLVAGVRAAPIDVPLDAPVVRGYTTYAAVRIIAVDPSTAGLRVRTSLGPFMLCYPEADSVAASCVSRLTHAQMSQAAGAFIQSTIPALVKAWAQRDAQ